jgi:protein SCO1
MLPAHRVRAVVPAVVLLLLVAVPACATDGADVAATASPTVAYPVPAWGYYGVPIEPTRPMPRATLTDQGGQPYRLGEDTAGKPVTLLYFGYTHCPDICPGTLAGIAVGMRGLPQEVADQVNVVFVTVDPARDTPAVQKEFLAHFDERFIGLSGDYARILRVMQALDLPAPNTYDLGGGEYGVGHPAEVLAFTADGQAVLEYPFGTKVEMWRHDLQKLVEQGWEAA